MISGTSFLDLVRNTHDRAIVQLITAAVIPLPYSITSNQILVDNVTPAMCSIYISQTDESVINHQVEIMIQKLTLLLKDDVSKFRRLLFTNDASHKSITLMLISALPSIAEKFTPEFLDDEDIVYQVASTNGSIFKFVRMSDRLMHDRDIILAAVKTGLPLYYVLPYWTDDTQIVQAAIRSSSSTEQNLRYASARLKDDEETVMMSIMIDPNSLGAASHRLRDTRSIVYEAMNMDCEVAHAASNRLRHDEDFIERLQRLINIQNCDMDITHILGEDADEDFDIDPESAVFFSEKIVANQPPSDWILFQLYQIHPEGPANDGTDFDSSLLMTIPVNADPEDRQRIFSLVGPRVADYFLYSIIPEEDTFDIHVSLPLSNGQEIQTCFTLVDLTLVLLKKLLRIRLTNEEFQEWQSMPQVPDWLAQLQIEGAGG